MASAFVNANRLTQVPAYFPSTVTDASSLFRGASSFNDPNVALWNTSQITNMSAMFVGATVFNQNISGWNVANATNMASMFETAVNFNQDISGWNVSNVTNMAAMFSSARAFNQNISIWNTVEVTDFSRMFFNATAYSHKPPLKLNKATDATNMLDLSGISDVTYSQTILDWFAASPKPTVYGLGAVDKTALCSIAGTIDSPHGKLMTLIASGWIVTDKSSRVSGHCDTTITVTATNTTQVYGNSVPSISFTPTVAGPRALDPTWVDAVTCSAKLTSGGDPVLSTTAPGTYVTQCSGPTSAGTGITVVYANGTHVITPKPISIKVKNRVERKNSPWTTATTTASALSDLPEYAITNGGLVGTDKISVTISKGATIVANKQFVLGGTLAATDQHDRYIVSFESGFLTISEKTYVVTAKNQTKVYGDDLTLDNANGWTCVEDNGSACSLTGRTVTLTSSGTSETATVGTYAINSSVSPTLSDSDYEIVNSNGGSITVTKRPLRVTPNALIVNAGSAAPNYTFDLENWALNSNDHPAMAGFTPPTCTSGYTPDTPRGTTLTITCSGGSSDLYYFEYRTATLTVPGLSEVQDLTPEQVNPNSGSGLAVVPFAFTVTPFLNVCFATLLVTDLADGSVTERRIQVSSSDVRFNLELPLGEYEYELVTDGNCAVAENSRSLTIAPQSNMLFPFLAPPQPQAISPSSAKPNTRTRATITGESLANVVRLRIGGKTINFVAATATTLKFKIPKLKPGRYDILLVMRDGTTQRWENQLRITGRSAAGTVSREFPGFAAGSSRITPAMKRAITKYLNDNKARFNTIECVGYTDGPFVRRSDVPLSMSRARVVCNLAESLGYQVVSRSYVNERVPGAQLRKVKLILGK